MDTAPHAPALFADIHALLDPGLTAPLVLADRSVDNLPISWDSFMPVQRAPSSPPSFSPPLPLAN